MNSLKGILLLGYTKPTYLLYGKSERFVKKWLILW
jgi:hypothetical protein